MPGYILKRLFRAFITIWLVATFTFIASRATGDPLLLLHPDGFTAETEADLREYYGLDGGIIQQYGNYLQGFLTGDLGTSYQQRRSVTTMVAERLPITLQLALPSLVIAILLGVPAGVIAAVNRGKPIDSLILAVSFANYALPSFVTGIGLIMIFSFTLHWLPSGSSGTWQHLHMPVTAMALGAAAGFARYTRSAMLDVLGQDYLRTARGKGLGPGSTILKHALRNAGVPVLTMIGLQLGTLVGGSVIIETVFSWPGLGRLLAEAATGRDFPVVQMGVLLISTTVVLSNLIIDIAYGALDPRIRLA